MIGSPVPHLTPQVYKQLAENKEREKRGEQPRKVPSTPAQHTALSPYTFTLTQTLTRT